VTNESLASDGPFIPLTGAETMPSVIHADCRDAMAAMLPESVDRPQAHRGGQARSTHTHRQELTQ